MRFPKTTINVLVIWCGTFVAGPGYADMLHVPGDLPAIQAAMDGDGPEAHPGTENESIELLGKAITVRSSDGAGVTTNGTYPGDGLGRSGGMFNEDSSPTVTNGTFSGNKVGFGGAGGPLDCTPETNCHIPDQMEHGAAGRVAATSDANPDAGFKVADSFRQAVEGEISELCWWAVYVDFAAGIIDCSPGPGDIFTVTYYSSDNSTLPGTVFAGPMPLTVTEKFDTGLDVAAAGTTFDEYQYRGTHTSVVFPADCYWIEIQNDTMAGDCFWLWETAPPGDMISAQDDDGTYDPGDESDYDMAWCQDVSQCSEFPVGACCAPGGDPDALCIPGIVEVECNADGGTFQGLGTTCDQCPVPTGACCQSGLGPACDITTEEACTAAGGQYQGAQSECSDDTGALQIIESDPLNLLLLDDGGPVTDTITVPGGDIIGDVDVDLQITHTWVGDVEVTLTHNGTTIVLISQPGDPDDLIGEAFGCGSHDYDIILDDEGIGGATEDLCAADSDPTPTSPPNYTPNEALNAFDGVSKSGDWTITVEDVEAVGDEGVFTGWSLHIRAQGESNCQAGGCNTDCAWDVDLSGDVRVPDLIKLLGCWGPLTGDPVCACLDIDTSGDIRVPDLIALLGKWGVCP